MPRIPLLDDLEPGQDPVNTAHLGVYQLYSLGGPHRFTPAWHQGLPHGCPWSWRSRSAMNSSSWKDRDQAIAETNINDHASFFLQRKHISTHLFQFVEKCP